MPSSVNITMYLHLARYAKYSYILFGPKYWRDHYSLQPQAI